MEDEQHQHVSGQKRGTSEVSTFYMMEVVVVVDHKGIKKDKT